MSNSAESPVRGWYSDPAYPDRERYWDGARWTQVVRRAESVRLKKPGQEKVTDPALDLPLSGWWRRFGSGIADTIIAWGLTAGVMFATSPDFLGRWWAQYMEIVEAYRSTGVIPPQSAEAFQSSCQFLLMVTSGVTAAYCIIFLGTWGATLGQKLLRIKVIKAPLPLAMLSLQGATAFEAEKPGWLRAVSKGLGWALLSTGGWFIVLQVANALMPLWHKRKQSVTDLFASTLVVRTTDKETT